MPEIVIVVEVDVQGRTLGEVEADLMSKVRAALAPPLQAALEAVAAEVEPGTCPGCGRQRRRRGMERRTVVGLFGILELRRQRVECRNCESTGYPADEVLGLEPGERYSLGVAEMALFSATDISYAKSAGTMKYLLDVGISHGQIPRLAQKEGALIQAEWERLRRQVFELGDRQILAQLEAGAAVKDLVIVQADGTFVNDRAADKMEAKAGIVYSRKVQISKGRTWISDKRTYSGVEAMKVFGEKLALVAAQQGAFKAKQLWFVSDGDANLRRLRETNFPTAIYFLDLWHLQDRLGSALGDEGRGQLGGLLTLAVNGDVDGMIEILADAWAAAGQDDQRRQLLGEVITYIDNNRDGIHNYAKHGGQGSGAIEKTIDIAIGRRLKNKGMSWYRAGADHILALRTLKQNRTWSPYWAARRSRTSLLEALAA